MAPGINEEEGVIRGPMNQQNQKALIEAADKKTADKKSKKNKPVKLPDPIGEPGPSRRDIDLGTVNESVGDDAEQGSGRDNVNEESGAIG
jgi:hypothetical protein